MLHPLSSWDIASVGIQKFMDHCLVVTKDLQLIYNNQNDYQWESLLYYRRLIMAGNCLVLTDTRQTISWVSHNFQQMTGYGSDEAIGRKPNFLQGPLTCQKTRRHIRERLQAHKEVKADIINYKKNGQPYLCQLHIFPIWDSEGSLVNYMAAEKAADI